jgi:cysteine desulfurase
LVVGLGQASAIALREHRQRGEQAAKIKTQVLGDLRSHDHWINGDQDRAQAHVLNVSFGDTDSEALMMALREVLAISNGAACASDRYASSHVLAAMGLSPARIESAVRISWGSGVDSVAVELIRKVIDQLR